MFFNKYVDWWHPLILLLLFSPLYYACYLYFKNLFSDKKEERDWLLYACLIVIGGVILFTVWNLIYFETIYGYKYIYHGFGEVDDYGAYYYQTKKDYMIYTILVSIIYISIFSYFALCCYTYAKLVEEKKSEEPE